MRSTVIEYEANLQDRRRYVSGYEQVQRYAAGIIESGLPVAQVRGILADTVEWHVYDVELPPRGTSGTGTSADCVLHEIDSINLEQLGAEGAEHFVAFLRKHFAREQSRSITAQNITSDLGLESITYRQHEGELIRFVNDARQSDSSAALAIQLWERFVDFLQQERGGFDASAYVDEAYLSILARLFCANVLARRALRSNHDELRHILNGRYFEQHWRLQNLVESDYFGWMLSPKYRASMLAIAGDIQRDLYAYDFAAKIADDLFGQLMAQLARRTRRKLLGQEWTPAWVAHRVIQKCMEMLPTGETPRLLDMCCGPGAMLAQAIKEARRRWPDLPFLELAAVATGFDIDPLAVMLAKTTWVVTLANEILAASDVVTVPVYHADSLFAVTPMTALIPSLDQSGAIPVDLDGQAVLIPAILITPAFRLLFDEVINWAYDEARHAQQALDPANIQYTNAEALIHNLIANHQLSLDAELTQRIVDAIFHLAQRMAQLAIEGRSGIWAFILRNTYRPGLVAGQFNGLVSNPPWLAMSQLADNPYLQYLDQRAKSYALKPKGAAYLHLDVATTHLLHAVDMYLKPGAAVVSLVPGTVLDGQHHLPFRLAQYRTGPRPVAFELQEVWDLPTGTFKAPAAVVVGVKGSGSGAENRTLQGGHLLPDAAELSQLQPATLHQRTLGNRVAWVIDGDEAPDIATSSAVAFRQGADLMPRTAVCVVVEDNRGREWSVHTPRQGDEYAFTVSDAKKLKGVQFSGRVAPRFLHTMIQSRNLLPFCLDNHLAPVAVPAERDAGGEWQLRDLPAIRAMAFRDTAQWFETINQAMERDEIALPLLHARINVRNKLKEQVFPVGQYLVLYGTGGGIACAACLPITAEQDFIVDQTLYWNLAEAQEEAWFQVGLLNSATLTRMTLDFNPSGNYGQRHLHTLPALLIPAFQPANPLHHRITELAMELYSQVQGILTNNAQANNPVLPIQTRRRQVRTILAKDALSAELESACIAAFSTAAP